MAAVRPCLDSLTALELRWCSCGAGRVDVMAGVVWGGLIWQEVDASPACAVAFTRAPRRCCMYVCD
eukprot:COSAG01_NODE_927_length_12693_cov_16.333810_13_plen_66_part_00